MMMNNSFRWVKIVFFVYYFGENSILDKMVLDKRVSEEEEVIN